MEVTRALRLREVESRSRFNSITVGADGATDDAVGAIVGVCGTVVESA